MKTNIIVIHLQGKDTYFIAYKSGRVAVVCGFDNLPKTAKEFIDCAYDFNEYSKKTGNVIGKTYQLSL